MGCPHKYNQADFTEIDKRFRVQCELCKQWVTVVPLRRVGLQLIPVTETKPMSKKKKYDVFISQVNRQVVTVEAESEEDAREKGYRKWRKDFANSYVEAVEEVAGE